MAEEFELSLPAGAGGYEWVVAETTAGLVRLESVGSEEETKGGEAAEEIGGDRPQRFRFRADRPGTFDAHLVYKRRWEKGVKPEDDYTANITVQGRK